MRTTKKVVLALILWAGFYACFAQDPTGFIGSQVLGNNKPVAPLQLSLDVYPFLFLSSGGGGSASVEFSNWQVGLTGFSVVPPDFILTTFFRNAENVRIRRNDAVELLVNYYPRKDRKGIYAGMLGGPEWFVMEEKRSGAQHTIVKTYVVPRLGIRVFPFKKVFYVDASFGWSFNVSGTEAKNLGQSTYNASNGGFIYFLQVGARLHLTKP